ncbi:MAG: trimethylamine methyltransferase family protein [Chloroflexota bacterium]
MSKNIDRQAKRAQRRNKRIQDAVKQPPFRQPIYRWSPLEIAPEEQIERIHNASMRILEEIGIRFYDDEALSLWEAAGAKVNHKEQHVWLDRELIMELVNKAPSSFTMRARNPERNVIIGGKNACFMPAAGMVYVTNTKTGRQPGSEETYIELSKLFHMSNVIHFGVIQAVAMHDVPVTEKHLKMRTHGYQLSDKIIWGVSHGRIISEDCLDAARIIFDGDIETGGPVTGGIINVNSPLIYDDRMLGGLISYARAGQPNVITPFILSGAMSPITIPATIAQQNAEALAGIALTQLVRPGTPVIYGGFTANIDLRSGSPAFGTPEGAWALLIGTQLARYYGVPYRGSGTLNTANSPDAQAAYESMWTLWPAIQAHTNLVIHAAGWLEGGLTVSYEKMIIDMENLAMMQYFLEDVKWGEDEFLLDMMAEVGPGGHHFATQHTQENYRTAFYDGTLADRSNFETWYEGGQQDIVQRAAERWQMLLNTYEAPYLDEGKNQALVEFVERRSRELQGVSLYD